MKPAKGKSIAKKAASAPKVAAKPDTASGPAPTSSEVTAPGQVLKPVDTEAAAHTKKKRNAPPVNFRDVKPLIIRDPIHDLIRVECPVAKALIETEPFQRLRRIKQLGLANMVYPGAEHSRFNHSLGVYHLAHRAMDAIDANLRAIGKEPKFTKGQGEGMHYRLLVGLCALLHDIGHGPFSHQFERVVKDVFEELEKKGAKPEKKRKHEAWTIQMIEEHPDVRGILNETAEHHNLPRLVEEMRQVIKGEFTPDYVTHLITSQMDVDRFDYLMRDSKNAGCHYGDFDINWILRSLLVLELDALAVRRLGGVEREDEGNESAGTGAGNGSHEVLVVHEQKGRNCVEEYILGRHYMYVHLYYHKTIVGAEHLLKAILKRAALLIAEGDLTGHYPALSVFAQGKHPDLDDYLLLDDAVVMGWVRSWARDEDVDPTLHDLSKRLVERRLFAKINPPRSTSASRIAHAALLAFLHKSESIGPGRANPEYYLLEAELSDSAHKDYLFHVMEGKNPENFKDVYIYDSSLKSPVIKLGDMRSKSVVIAGSSTLQLQETSWFVPKEVYAEAEQIVARYR
jgi:HD superfamily phosphohydrolase